MSDIVERLRADLASGLSASLGDTMEAADEIEKLRAALRPFIHTGNVEVGYRIGQNPPPITASIEEAWAHYGGNEFYYQQWLQWRAVQIGRELLGEKE